jgi:hypothetical protein
MNDEEIVSGFAFETWCSISDEEKDRLALNKTTKKICIYAYTELWKVIQYHFTNRNAQKEKLNEDSWTNLKAASCLLGNLSQCCGENLVNDVFVFVGQNISSQDPLLRDSAILAFSSILETTYSDYIKNAIKDSGATMLLNMLNDPSSEVRGTVSYALKRICELHADCLTNQELFHCLITNFVHQLETGTKKVIINICDGLHFLALRLKPLPEHNYGYMSNYLVEILNKLLTIAYKKGAYEPTHNVALSAFFAMGTLIEQSPLNTHAYVNEFFTHIVNAFQSTLEQGKYNDEEERYAYQTYLATIISSCCQGEKIKLNAESTAHLFNLLKTSFEQNKDIYEEGIMAGSSIAQAAGLDFVPFLQEFMTFLCYGLNQINKVTLCRICINSLSELVRSLGDQMENHMANVITLVLKILEDASSDRTLKTQSFIVISDMFLYTKVYAITYYKQIMSFVMHALAATEYIADNEDQETVDYFKGLRENLLECITCIIHCLKDAGKIGLFDEHVPSVVQFIEKIVDPKFSPTYVFLIY